MKKNESYNGKTWEDFERQKFTDAGLDPDEVYKKAEVLSLTPMEKREKSIYELKRISLYIGAVTLACLIVSVINSCIISMGLYLGLGEVLVLGFFWMFLMLRFMFSQINKKYPKYSVMRSYKNSNSSSGDNIKAETSTDNSSESVFGETVHGSEGNNDFNDYLIDSEESTATIKISKIRYCKMCGGVMDLKTKKCTQCGKQYFKFDIRKCKPYIFSVLSIFSFVSIYFIDDFLLKIYLIGYSTAYKECKGVSLNSALAERASMYNRITGGAMNNPLSNYVYDNLIIGIMVAVGLIFAVLAFCSFRKRNK